VTGQAELLVVNVVGFFSYLVPVCTSGMQFCMKLVFIFLQDNPLENLNTAFDVAAKHCNIPKMLVAEGGGHSVFFAVLKILILAVLLSGQM